VIVEGELSYREYERTIETPDGPVRVQWPLTEILIKSVKVLDRQAKRGRCLYNKNVVSGCSGTVCRRVALT
jgi:hypothetical protein